MLPYLKGQEVFGYVDGTLNAPPTTITDANGTSSPNPQFAAWSKQDNLILSAINSSLTEEVLAQVYQATTSCAIWLALESCFASQSHAKVVQVCSELSTAHKGSSTATEYFMSIKKLTDELAIAGQAMSIDDIITYVLVGLGSEYDSLVTMVSSRDTTTLEDLYSLLLTVEARINHNQQALSLPIAAANLATRQPFSSSTGRGRGTFSSNNNRGQGRSNGRGRGANNSGRVSFNNHSNRCCQLCEKPGHTVHTCWWRFDVNFIPPNIQRPAQANYASSSSSTSQDWHPDSGATHHMTANVKTLSLRSDEYTGADQIQIGNGAGLLGERPT
ncbi:hypothetical protein F0562_013341 [Nyssa sinensis]|uniref:Retrotransposon Copia-like N-terminal domain-containing protein n=1 Tax=Nyssa sinensis TaxID=561372 RepID=A0A5J4ZKH1_9ASTE|nr:hypothetical protein F0562_013341 [Nyssa sinensis]